jgi:hypothetical protein
VNRELRFRAKSKTSGEWKYGYPYVMGMNLYMHSEHEYAVECVLETLCQFTGIYDTTPFAKVSAKMAREVYEQSLIFEPMRLINVTENIIPIYENDIVHVKFAHLHGNYIVRWNNKHSAYGYWLPPTEKWDDGFQYMGSTPSRMYKLQSPHRRVVGNTIDNPLMSMLP